MGLTTLYYFLAFIIFFACLIGVQKWFKLSEQKKDTVGLIVLSAFLISLLAFVLIIIFKPNYFSAQTTIAGMIAFFFLIVVFFAFFIKWYNDKYNKKINASTVIIVLCLAVFAIVFLILKFIGNKEKENIVKNVALKTTVTNISFDSHKPYFKDMALADGQYLPMPETMNETLQIGDSIYKVKGENLYTVVNAKTKIKTNYEVKIHERMRSKPQ